MKDTFHILVDEARVLSPANYLTFIVLDRIPLVGSYTFCDNIFWHCFRGGKGLPIVFMSSNSLLYLELYHIHIKFSE